MSYKSGRNKCPTVCSNFIIYFQVQVKPCDVFLMPGAVKKEVYFMAIIDILTHYDAKKKAAHAAKTVKHGVSDMTTSYSIRLWPSAKDSSASKLAILDK